FTGAFQFAYEARSYGLGVGLFALALFTWLEAAAGRHRRRNLAIMAMALGAGLWAHYYLALAFVPMILGEMVRQTRRRHFELAPVVALGSAAVVALPLLSLVLANASLATHHWTRLLPMSVLGTYDFVLGSVQSRRFRYPGGIAIAVVVAFELARRTS